MKIGIRAHDMGKMDAKSLFQRAQSFGFDGIQLVINKALIEEPELTEAAFKTLSTHQQGVEVLLLGSYFNPIHSNHEKVQQGVDRFLKQLELAHTLNTAFVASETGSYNDDQWTYHEQNHTKTAYDQVLSVFKPLVKKAESVGKTVLVEAAYGHVIFSPYSLKRFVMDLDSPNVKVIIDLFNLLNLRNHRNHESILKEALHLLKEDIAVFHLKNYQLQEGKLVQVGLNKGLFDYKKLLPMMLSSNPDAYYIFEGITGDDIIESMAYIKQIKEENQ
jgi:sugar phosphate isomerase/epimerase